MGQGRVWSGSQALERGLVDRNGGLRDALAAAAQRAGLPEGHRVQYLEPEPRWLGRLLQDFGSAVAAAIGGAPELRAAALALSVSSTTTQGLVQDMAGELGWLAKVAERRQPLAAVVHCLCAAP